MLCMLLWKLAWIYLKEKYSDRTPPKVWHRPTSKILRLNLELLYPSWWTFNLAEKAFATCKKNQSSCRGLFDSTSSLPVLICKWAIDGSNKSLLNSNFVSSINYMQICCKFIRRKRAPRPLPYLYINSNLLHYQSFWPNSLQSFTVNIYHSCFPFSVF